MIFRRTHKETSAPPEATRLDFSSSDFIEARCLPEAVHEWTSCGMLRQHDPIAESLFEGSWYPSENHTRIIRREGPLPKEELNRHPLLVTFPDWGPSLYLPQPDPYVW